MKSDIVTGLGTTAFLAAMGTTVQPLLWLLAGASLCMTGVLAGVHLWGGRS